MNSILEHQGDPVKEAAVFSMSTEGLIKYEMPAWLFDAIQPTLERGGKWEIIYSCIPKDLREYISETKVIQQPKEPPAPSFS